PSRGSRRSSACPASTPADSPGRTQPPCLGGTPRRRETATERCSPFDVAFFFGQALLQKPAAQPSRPEACGRDTPFKGVSRPQVALREGPVPPPAWHAESP